MYEQKDAEAITVQKSDRYTNAVDIEVNYNGYQRTTLSLTRADFVSVIAQGLGYPGIGAEVFNLASWLESKVDPDTYVPDEPWMTGDVEDAPPMEGRQ